MPVVCLESQISCSDQQASIWVLLSEDILILGSPWGPRSGAEQLCVRKRARGTIQFISQSPFKYT